MSDLERAQEWLGCDTPPDSTWCEEHMHPLPCHEAARLAALLAETRADALEEAADAWSDWDALSAPEDWLRDRADRIERGESS